MSQTTQRLSVASIPAESAEIPPPHYISKTEKTSKSRKRSESVGSVSKQRRTPRFNQVCCANSTSISIGLLFVLIAIILLAGDKYNYEASAKLFGWGMFLVFGTLAVRLTRFLNKDYLKVDDFIPCVNKVLIVVAVVLTWFITFNFLAIGFLGTQIVCKRGYFIFIPDSGLCECDDRELLTSETTPFFVDGLELSRKIVVASVGDVDLKRYEPTLRLVKEKNPDVLVINGDLTYRGDPEGADRLITKIFGANFPVLITVGNHDTGIWTDYQKVFLDRYNRYLNSLDEGVDPLEVIRCEGEVGVNEICSYQNMGFVLNGLGSTCMKDSFLESQLDEQLDSFVEKNLTWRTVFIHKNQNLLQTGDKPNEVGIFAYKKSLEAGAIVMNAHEHQYARTKQLKGVGEKTEDFIVGSSEETVEGKELIEVGGGNFLVVSNGLGGKSMREVDKKLARNEWWSSLLHEGSENIDYGAHFCEYNFNGTQNLARCFFETVQNVVTDEYFVRSLN